MKVRVVREKCISASSCVAILPDVFELDKDGIAIIKREVQNPDGSVRLDEIKVTKQHILDAAKSCPTEAIIVEDDGGKQTYP